MADKKLTAFRCPDELLQLIEAEMKETDASKSEVLVKRLMMAYGQTDEQPEPSVVVELTEAIANITERLEALEKPQAA